jgi:hypothetical protein
MSHYFYDKGVCTTCGAYIICVDRGREGYYLTCSNRCYSEPMTSFIPAWVDTSRYSGVNNG